MKFLADNSAAGHEGGGDLEGEEVKREVPGRDQPRHADRLPAGDVDHPDPALAIPHQALPRCPELQMHVVNTSPNSGADSPCESCARHAGCP